MRADARVQDPDVTEDDFDDIAPQIQDALVAQDSQWGPEGRNGLLLGFLLITEWVAPDGLRRLSVNRADPQGVALPEWQALGYLDSARGIIIEQEGESDGEAE